MSNILLEYGVGLNTNYYASDIYGQIDLKAKAEEYDCVTYGIEDENGKVIKVYIEQDQAEAFEEALAKCLSDELDVADTLNNLVKEFNIVDVIWPNEKRNDEDLTDLLEPTKDGSESLNPNVNYAGVSIKKEHLSLGKSFLKNLMEKQDEPEVTPEIQEPVDNKVVVNNLSSLILWTLLEIGLPQKVVDDNKTEIHDIIMKYSVNLFYDYSDRLAALRYFKDSVTRIKHLSENDEDRQIQYIDGSLERYFKDRKAKQIYRMIRYLGITDKILLRRGNANIVVNSIIDKGQYYKKNAREYAYFHQLYQVLINSNGK